MKPTRGLSRDPRSSCRVVDDRESSISECVSESPGVPEADDPSATGGYDASFMFMFLIATMVYTSVLFVTTLLYQQGELDVEAACVVSVYGMIQYLFVLSYRVYWARSANPVLQFRYVIPIFIFSLVCMILMFYAKDHPGEETYVQVVLGLSGTAMIYYWLSLFIIYCCPTGKCGTLRYCFIS